MVFRNRGRISSDTKQDKSSVAFPINLGACKMNTSLRISLLHNYVEGQAKMALSAMQDQLLMITPFHNH
jgi:hypothetical protein